MTDTEIATKLTEVDQRGKANAHRIEDLEKRQGNLDSLVTSVAVIATRQTTMENDVTEIKGDVKSLTCKPGQRWDTLVEQVIWLVVAVVVVL